MADQANTTTEAPGQWTEADYAAALKHLQRLQDQIDNLRETIPSLAEHFAPPPRSTITPTQLYRDFAQAAKQASTDVKKCRADWHEDRTQRLLDQARMSLENREELEWEFVCTSRWHNLEGLEDDIAAPGGVNGVQKKG